MFDQFEMSLFYDDIVAANIALQHHIMILVT